MPGSGAGGEVTDYMAATASAARGEVKSVEYFLSQMRTELGVSGTVKLDTNRVIRVSEERFDAFAAATLAEARHIEPIIRERYDTAIRGLWQSFHESRSLEVPEYSDQAVHNLAMKDRAFGDALRKTSSGVTRDIYYENALAKLADGSVNCERVLMGRDFKHLFSDAREKITDKEDTVSIFRQMLEDEHANDSCRFAGAIMDQFFLDQIEGNKWQDRSGSGTRDVATGTSI